MYRGHKQNSNKRILGISKPVQSKSNKTAWSYLWVYMIVLTHNIVKYIANYSTTVLSQPSFNPLPSASQRLNHFHIRCHVNAAGGLGVVH